MHMHVDLCMHRIHRISSAKSCMIQAVSVCLALTKEAADMIYSAWLTWVSMSLHVQLAFVCMYLHTAWICLCVCVRQ